MNKKKQLEVFCDFDGTITQLDLGDEVFKKFGQFEPYHTQLVNKEIDIKTYWYRLCETIPPDITEDEIYNLAMETPVDIYFSQFIDYLASEDIPITIISDGFESYIKPILERENLTHIPYLSNKLEFDNGKVIPVFPRASEACTCMTASCKRNSMLSRTYDDAVIVYIGDGYSDFCGAEHSDIIFAKKNLAAYCNANKLPHYSFKTFFDIIRIFKNIIKTGKIKKRNQAFINRKNAFETE